jgi:hypothetical protein
VSDTHKVMTSHLFWFGQNWDNDYLQSVIRESSLQSHRSSLHHTTWCPVWYITWTAFISSKQCIHLSTTGVEAHIFLRYGGFEKPINHRCDERMFGNGDCSGTQLDRSDSEQSPAATTVVLMESLYVLALYFCALSKVNVVQSMKLCVLMLGHSC